MIRRFKGHDYNEGQMELTETDINKGLKIKEEEIKVDIDRVAALGRKKWLLDEFGLI